MRASSLFIAVVLLACRPSHAKDAPKPAPIAAFPEPTVKLWDGKLGDGWQDYGWAPRKLDASKPASLDLSGYGGWIIAHPELPGRYGGVRIKYRAPASFGEFIEVRVDSSLAQSFPRVALDSGYQRATPDGWMDAYVPMAELDPKGYPFDRVILRAFRDVGHDPVEISLIALTAGSDAVAPPTQVGKRKVTLTIDCRAPSHAISPLIYGIAYDIQRDATKPEPWSLGATARRWGGNPASRYNWKLGNAWNTASDWFFQNVDYTGAPGAAYQRFLDDDLAHGVQSALTIPTIGFVAKDTHAYSFPVSSFGKQQKVAPEQPNAGNGMTPDGKKITPGPASATSVPAPPEFMADWVKAIRAKDADGPRHVQQYILDNEPALWNSTHRDVHPAALGYDELLDRTISYAKAIKQVDPKAVIAGPAEWGWPAYQYSAVDAEVGFSIAPDRLRHGNTPLLPWWLRKLREYREKNGVNLVDILDVHFYPQAEGMGIGPSGGTDADTNARRLRSTRALWDPSYVDESWIKAPVMLLPRLQKWIDENNPGMGISIGEWNFGAEKDMSGGLAVAETLGRFGQAGITSAFYWTYPAEGTPAYWGFRAFRNYDGQGAHFLESSVVTRSSDPMTSVFASKDASGKLVVVALNLDPGSAVEAEVQVASCGAYATGRTFAYGGDVKGFAPAESPVHGVKVETKLGPYSATVIELKPGAGSVHEPNSHW